MTLTVVGLPRVPNKWARLVLGYCLTSAAGYAAYKVLEWYMTKTGYRITSYLR